MNQQQTSENQKLEIQNYSIDDACVVMGIGRTTAYALIKSGELKVVKIGAKSLVPRKSLLAFQKHLESISVIELKNND